MARAKLKRSVEKRREIILAALACFTEHGYEKTTLAFIRKRSGASTGSIYHHFESKDQLAAAVYLDGVIEWQRGFAEELERHRSAKAGIKAIVRYHLHWVHKNPEWSRYLFQMRRFGFMSSVEEDIKRVNEQFITRIGAWFRGHIEAGRLKILPREVFVSILLGPSQDLAKLLLSGPSRLEIDSAARLLGDAAWQSLKAK